MVRVRTCVQSCACSGVIRRIEGTARASGSREPRQRARRHPQENLPRGALPVQERSRYRSSLPTGEISLQEIAPAEDLAPRVGGRVDREDNVRVGGGLLVELRVVDLVRVRVRVTVTVTVTVTVMV